jgi:hypothetical protein
MWELDRGIKLYLKPKLTLSQPFTLSTNHTDSYTHSYSHSLTARTHKLSASDKNLVEDIMMKVRLS